MPSTVRPVSRRRVLIGAAALAALAATASGCDSSEDSSEPPQPEELEPQLDLALRDTQMASAAAAAAGPFYGPLLHVVADERALHANALTEEIARAPDATVTSSRTAPTSSTPAAPPPSRNDVITALRESADSAAKLAANVAGSRAGLLGSIAASCTASVVVSLALKEPTP